jgi:hypothetical protein
MRTKREIAALSLALLVGGCGKRAEQTAVLSEDLKKDLAAASATGGDLAIAPQSYQRMRFVSDIEQAKASMPAKRPKLSHHKVRPTVRPQPAAETTSDVTVDEVASAASESPAPASTTEAPVPEPTVVVAQNPSPEPTNVPAESPSAGQASGRGGGGGGGGWGGLLGGIIGAVVIRGGHGGVDKCDPRTDGRGRFPVVIDRPDFGLPLPTGQPTFPRSPRR